MHTPSTLTWIALCSLLAIVVMAGCTADVELLSSAPAMPAMAATVVPQEHDLAIVAVDFDPPLDYAQVLSRGEVSLLVAVRNEGRLTESDVRVEARLLDAAQLPEQRELLDESLALKELAPGEIRVVRFSPVSELPREGSYQLQVSVEPVSGETDTGANFRTYTVAIRTDD